MGTWIALGVVAFFAWVIWRERRAGRAWREKQGQVAAGATPKIRGTGRFAAEVVGESFYRKNFASLFPPRGEEDDDMEVEIVVTMRLEDSNPHDSNAVGIYYQEKKLGHLPRQLAQDFRQAIARDKLSTWSEFLVDAVVIVSSDKDDHYSISVDLPVI